MRGITEKELQEYKDASVFPDWVIDELLAECTELNPWKPIESAPKDRRILLFFPGYGWYDGGYLMTRRDGVVVFAASASLSVPLGIWATHWQELPEDPK